MKEEYFEVLESERPFTVHAQQTPFGWYILTRALWNLKVEGGHWALLGAAQGAKAFLTATAAVAESIVNIVVIAVLYTAKACIWVAQKLFTALLNRFFGPMLFILGVLFTLILVWVLYRTGLLALLATELTRLFTA